MRNVLALSWFEHRRTTGLCHALNLELIVHSTRVGGALRYLILGVRTTALLVRRRPAILLVQNPSLILSALAVLLRPLLNYRLIVDAHNEAVMPFMNQQRWVRHLARWVIRKADLTIVTNRQLAQIVERHSGRPFTLPDPTPVPPPFAARALPGSFTAVLISTFAPDEPVAEVFAAVRGLDIELYVTGNHRKLPSALLAAVPPNVHFCGFLPEEEYWSLLQSADAAVDLTLMDNCLVCGAYEALALGKPMLLSNNPATVELFSGAAVFTDNTAPDIRLGLERLRLSRDTMKVAADHKRGELTERWIASAGDLTRIMRTEKLPEPQG
jgi:glycosyltransferase involved in cell wall biosynthesis